MELQDSRTAIVGAKRARSEDYPGWVSASSDESFDPSEKRRKYNEVDDYATISAGDTSDENIDRSVVAAGGEYVHESDAPNIKRQNLPSKCDEDELERVEASSERICTTDARASITLGCAILVAVRRETKDLKAKTLRRAFTRYILTKLSADLVAYNSLVNEKGPQALLAYSTSDATRSAIFVANGAQLVVGTTLLQISAVEMTLQDLIPPDKDTAGQDYRMFKIERLISAKALQRSSKPQKDQHHEPSHTNSSGQKGKSTESHVDATYQASAVVSSNPSSSHLMSQAVSQNSQTGQDRSALETLPFTSIDNPLISSSTYLNDINMQESPATIPNVEPRTMMKHLTSHERILQTRYWGIEGDDSLVICPVCSEGGHMSEQCPAMICKHCGAAGQHFAHACPLHRKCQRCKENGHVVLDCPSKLARSAADGFLCDLCDGPHSETQCSWIWRSFDPAKQPLLRKVDKLIVSCYQCGVPGHWGDDCILRPRNKIIHSDMFSSSFANKFLNEPSRLSNQNGLSFRGTTNLLAKPKFENGLSIRGKAQQNSFCDDDSSSDQANFYGKRFKAIPQSNRSITINTSNFRPRPEARSYQGGQPSTANLGSHRVGHYSNESYSRGYHAVPPPQPESYNRQSSYNGNSDHYIQPRDVPRHVQGPPPPDDRQHDNGDSVSGRGRGRGRGRGYGREGKY